MVDTNLFLLIVAGVLGLVVGSFLNVVIYRLPIMLKNEYEESYFEYFHHQLPTKFARQNLLIPSSYCPHCKSIIPLYHNIPLFSYIFLGGKCCYCKAKISARYPIVEALGCITTIFIVSYFGIQLKTIPTLIPTLILNWMLIAAVFIDLEQQLLPDNITLPLIWLGLLINANNIFTSPTNAIIGASLGYLTLWTLTKVFKMVRKVDGMGCGDFKLLAVFGSWLGWQFVPLIIFAASVMGVIFGLLLVLGRKYKFNQPLPFGPYLATAGWLALFWGHSILTYYKYYWY